MISCYVRWDAYVEQLLFQGKIHSQKNTPFIWLDGQAGKAANYYVSFLEDAPSCALGKSKGHSITRYNEASSEIIMVGI